MDTRKVFPGALVASLFVAVAVAHAAQPPLCVEVNADHPLFIFRTREPDSGDPAAYAQEIARAWATLADELKPYAVLAVDVGGVDLEPRHERLTALLGELQGARIPVAVTLADADPRRVYPLELAEELLGAFTCIKGVEAGGLSFAEYYEFGGGDDVAMPPNVRWLFGAIDLAARHGRFIAMPFDELHWPRIMANAGCRPLYEKIRECRAYTIPLNRRRGPHEVARTASLLGLWLEGATAQWGVEASSRWYLDACFVEPGVFGPAGANHGMPAALYRAMILNGAMTGATVYSFPVSDDLWNGKASAYWDEAVYPTLSELLDRGLIASKRFIREKLKVAYQLTSAQTSQEFHLNLRDIDGVYDAGRLIHGAYGMERPGQVPELILNTGRYYWIPILSAYAPEDTLTMFREVVRPGAMNSAAMWRDLLARHYEPDSESAAFVTQVGRGIFVMHTRENLYEEQGFAVREAPAPVRDIRAELQGNEVALAWPFRDGDVSYRVYKRELPDGRFVLLARDVDIPRYTDTGLEGYDAAAYTVTAVTNEKEPYRGTVNYGDYLALSVVESRIVEEVRVSVLLRDGTSRPVAEAEDPRPKTQAWWPGLEGLTEEEAAVAQPIAQRIEAWDAAFAREDLNGVLDLYATDYEDPQGWRFQYVRRAFQWFFERYDACKMHRQIRRWDFDTRAETGAVNVLLYCRFTGVAQTDASGRFADIPVHFPRTRDGEVWLAFSDKEGPWRIVRSNPAVPNFKDILSFSAPRNNGLSPGPDWPKN